LHREVVLEAGRLGLPFLPGVTTPSEVLHALGGGFQVVKLFPAGPLGSDWIRALGGPFPLARFVAVGGITAQNARSFMEVGAVGVGVASALRPDSLADLVGAVTR
jgi:2-dehydro-3-deoxyphosphogluconate aldolase / (4S)-4-hydroxy-2-oxoglutarate aldolase